MTVTLSSVSVPRLRIPPPSASLTLPPVIVRFDSVRLASGMDVEHAVQPQAVDHRLIHARPEDRDLAIDVQIAKETVVLVGPGHARARRCRPAQ